MKTALIGYSGFVGTTLLQQTSFTDLFRSTNIGDINGQSFDLVVCAGAPAQKWIANRDPSGDKQIIENLITHLRTLSAKKIVLLSTVDVFSASSGVDETTAVDTVSLHAYGANRRMLEVFIESHFADSLIVRLPGLVGPRLRKNIIFDLLNNNNLKAIDHRGIFQFYPMVNLWGDIQIALDAKLRLIHLTAEPVSVERVASGGFGRAFANELAATPAIYDMRSVHAKIFGGSDHYQYSARETIQAIRCYAQSEPLAPATSTP